MEGLWDIISGWEPVGQGLFFLVVMWSIFSLGDRVLYYLMIWLRGWPPGESDRCARGDFQVGCGTHEVHVATPSAPEQVWVGFGDEPDVAVCQGNVDMVGVSPAPDGFIAHVEIRSRKRRIKWRADL